jgi:hypothetical protein
MKYILICLLFVSCNAFELVSDVKSSVDPGFNRDSQIEQSLRDDLEAFWNFEENASSNKQSQFHGHVFNINTFGAEPTPVNSTRGRGLYCVPASNPTSNEILKTSSSIPFANDFTFSIWIKFNSIPGSSSTVLSETRYSTVLRSIVFKNSDVNSNYPDSFNLFDNSIGLPSPLNFSRTSDWTHLVIKFSITTNQFDLYQDGEFKSSSGFATAISGFSDTDLTLCSKFTPSTSAITFQGAIDSFGIWNRHLNEKEIKYLSGVYTELD